MSFDSGGSGKEMTLKKIYELALTAIAFLSFGIFVLQVIMCITAVSIRYSKQNNPFAIHKMYTEPVAIGKDTIEFDDDDAIYGHRRNRYGRRNNGNE